MIKILFGNEPYLMDQQKHAALEMIHMPEINLSHFEGFSSDTVSFLNTYPLGDSVRVAIVNIANLKELETQTFKCYSSAPSPTGVLLVICNEVDKRTAFYKELLRRGYLCPCDKITDPMKVQKIILYAVNAAGGRITNNAYALFMENENYFERDDITLLNVLSDVKKLVAFQKDITVDSVKLLIKKNPQEDIWNLLKMIQARNLPALREQANILHGKEIGTLSALLREYRLGYKSLYFTKSEIGAKVIALSNAPKQDLLFGIDTIMSVIDGLKNGSMPQNTALLFTFEKLCFAASVKNNA